jgi:hypothetical protein
MSDTAMMEKAAACLRGISQGCQILILSEDFAAYSRATLVCRRFMDRFGQDVDFDFRCWNFIELTDPECAHNAMKYGAVAEIIVISVQNPVLPVMMNEWIEALPKARFRADGALLLVVSGPANPVEIQTLVTKLENLALRLVMDFVPLLPASGESDWHSQPTENWPRLAAEPDVIQPPNPEHWGLNE